MPTDRVESPRKLPAAARRSLFIYNLFFPLVFVAMLPGFLLRMFRRGGYQEKFGQRLSRYSAEDRARLAAGKWTWVHSISVGETLVALKLARELRRREPDTNIVLSVTTSTGFALARQGAPDWLEVIYNPVDLASFIRTTLDLIRPRRIVLIEGEAWPNLVAESYRRSIPIVLANARLSPRSAARFRKFRALTAPIFQLLDHVLVPEREDIVRWEGLGFPHAKLVHTGSIKFDQAAAAAESRVEEFRGILQRLGVSADAPIIVAGSTWEPEELALARAFADLRLEFPKLLLILVPRHVERVPAILRDLEPTGLRIVRRTAAEPGNGAAPEIFLVDTTGELRDWYQLATVVFIGKSLPGIAEVGGQNPGEPAALGKPVVFGPHMENFESITRHLREHGACIAVADAPALADAIRDLLRSPDARENLGTRAVAVLTPHQGATVRAADAILGGSSSADQ